VPRRCTQCWKNKPLKAFYSKKSRRCVKKCDVCREHYAIPESERPMRHWRSDDELKQELRVRLILDSKNRKTGAIPQTMTSPGTCPRSCPWYGGGCYSEYHVLGLRWRKTPKECLPWNTFCDEVQKFPENQLWRHNIGGDLPGMDEEIDVPRLDLLMDAAMHTRGFTYTHKPVLNNDTNAKVIREANILGGLAISLSADNPYHADELFEAMIAPVCVVVSREAPKVLKTPKGRRILVCPAQTSDTTCVECELCADPGRKNIIGFRAHGCAIKQVTTRVLQTRLPFMEGT